MGLKDYSALRLGSRTIIAAYRGDLQVFGAGVGDPVAPTVSTPPEISGTPRVGETLTVTPGIYAGYPAPTVTRQWRRGTANISGATGLTYVPTAADIGRSITLRETAVNAAGSITSTSAAIGPVEAVPTVPAAFDTGSWSVAPGDGDGEIVITITSLPASGGADITGVDYRLGDGAWGVVSGTLIGTHVITAPAAGASYQVSLRAVNALGAGPASEVRDVTSGNAGANLPDAPFASDLSWRLAAENVTGVANGAGIASLPIDLASEAFAQTTAAARPTYVATSAYGGRPGIRFSGSQFMSVDIGSLLGAVAAENYSVFVIYSDATGAGNNPGRILSASGGNGFEIFAGADAVKANAQVYEKTGVGNGFGTLGFSFQDPNSEMGNANGSGLYDCYVDGGAIWRQTANTAPAINDTTLWLGAMNAGQYYRFSGVLHEILIWNRRLTQAEMISVQKWACDKYGQPYPWAGEDAYTLFSGDSLTVGVGAAAATSYPNVLMNAKGVPNGAWSMLAVGGASQTNLTGYDPGAVAAIREVVDKPVVILSHEWANQMTTGNMPSKATWFTALDAIPDVYVATGTSVGSNRDATPANLTLRQNFDAAMVAAPTTVGHLLVPLHTDSRIGSYTSWATNGATYWTGDNLHFNAAGYAVMAELFSGAYENLITLVNGGTPATVPGNFLSSMFTATTGSAAGEININITSLPADGGSAITGFDYTLTGGATWGDLPGGAGTGTRTITAPAAGANYNVYIRAKNAVGVGVTAQSNAVTSGVAAATGSVPGNFLSSMFTATTGSAAGEININITSLPADGGSAITGFDYTLTGGATWGDLPGGAGTGTRTITAPAAGANYNVYIRAKNAVGVGVTAQSNAVTSGAGAVTGSAPEPFTSAMWTAVPGATPGTVDVNILSLPSDGGSPITVLRWSRDSGTTWTNFTGTGTGVRTITLPAAGTSYDIWIAAINAVGNAPGSMKTVTSGA